MEKYKITFLPSKKTVLVPQGNDILTAAISAGENITASCGGDGICGRCKVILKSGKVKSETLGKLTESEIRKGYILACASFLESDAVIEIPRGSTARLEDMQADVSKIELGKKRKVNFKFSPTIGKIYLKLPKPNMDDRLSDLDRVERELEKNFNNADIKIEIYNVRKFSAILRESDWNVTLTLLRNKNELSILSIEAQDTSKSLYALSFDIGTTTISAQLINLKNGDILGTKSTYNKQISYGDDVITRIIYAQDEKGGLEKLNHAVIENINSLMMDFSKEFKVSPANIYFLQCSGNTTMAHLLLRINPSHIRREPYISTANFYPVVRASELGIRVNPNALLSCTPGISAYVGGDITSGVLSSGIYSQNAAMMLIDIGTNGEIAIGNKEWIAAASASAGPAFEGSGMTSGMRAASGAIDGIKVTGNKIELSVIGNLKPRGICGSGYIDIIGTFMDKGIISKDGKFNTKKFASRIRRTDSGLEFVLAKRQDTSIDKDIVIKESDVDNIKRAKAAIYAAVQVLLKKVGISIDNVEKIYIAGGFGTYLNIDKAVKIGLLPNIDRKKYEYVGNSSLKGSTEMLLSNDAKEAVSQIAKKMTYIELGNDPLYNEEYVASLFFPHTDVSRFEK